MIDLTGQKFGRFVIIGQAGKDKWGKLLWLCRCDCGNETIVQGSNLKSGSVKSCGCLRRERLTKHGYAKNRKVAKIYTIWVTMIQRCTNPNNKKYKNYGGRGIKVCKHWRKFENFLKDMGLPPTHKHQIDRINNDKGYRKSNCR